MTIRVWRYFWGSLLVLAGEVGFAQAGDVRAHYTADRPVDFVHMRLSLDFTEEGLRSRRCEGRVEHVIRPRGVPLNTLKLDAVGMEVLGVEGAGEEELKFVHDDRVLTVELPGTLGLGEETEVTVRYRLEDPVMGMYFVLPSDSVPEKPLMVYTMSEPLEARYWFPCHDWPNERWTSDIRVTVPERFTVVANGVLVERAVSGGRATFNWRSEVAGDPHMMGMVLGELVELRAAWRGRPVLTYTQPGLEAEASYTFRRVPEMMEFYSREIGIDFPYPGYSHVTVVEHHHGGMEHAGFSFVRPDYMARSENGEWWMERTQTHYLAHMLGHMWFGGVANYRSVSEAWLNEGFASHLHELWLSSTDPDPEARLEYDYWMMARKVARFDDVETGTPLVDRHLEEVGDIYTNDGGKLYDKGSWVVRMLRGLLGDSLFWEGVRHYLKSHEWGSVETSDLRQALEAVSGRDLERFFQRWIYGRGIPRLAVEYRWELGERAIVTVIQEQKVDGQAPAFWLPLELSFVVGGEVVGKEVVVDEERREFSFEFAEEPSQFVVDPRGRLLKTLEVRMPLAMKLRQVRDGRTVWGRLDAVLALENHGGVRAVRALAEAVGDREEFWGVSSLAAEALGRMGGAEALGVLVKLEREGIAGARVMASVVGALGKYENSAEAHEAVLRHAGSDQALEVQAAAVAALAGMRGTVELERLGRERLAGASKKPTRRWVRAAALRALGRSGAGESFGVLSELAQPARGDELRVEAITALGVLGRKGEFSERARAVLRQWDNDPDRRARAAVVEALAGLSVKDGPERP